MSYTADQLALKAFLESRKAETEAWVAEDPTNRWATYPTTDLDHWIAQGVNSVAQFERRDMEATIWDLFKDVNGYRPRGYDFERMSDEELSDMYDRLLDELDESNKREKERQARAIEDFESTIANVICLGALERETAVRWLREAEQDEDAMYDDGYFEYDYGLPYGYLKNGKADPLYN